MLLRATALALLVSACTVGDVRDRGVVPSSPDADPSAPDADPSAPDAAPAAACASAATPPGSGHHNAGQACIACHAANGGPTFTVAGTLYDGAGAALAGATITIVDANGTQTPVVTTSNGNFYTSATLAFPVHVSASLCPATKPMSAAVSDGDCNSCHVSGNQGAIHLP